MPWSDCLKAGLLAAPLAITLAWPVAAFQGVPESDTQSDEATTTAELAVEEPSHSYYVEFRVAENGLYGHSYIAYGPLTAMGQPASAVYADLHPTGELPSLLLGHFIPMKAATTPARATPRRKVASRYLRLLTVMEYQKLLAVVARARAERHEWSIVGYNCNDFVAEVARGIGLQTPNTLVLPYEFIPELQAMNESAPVARTGPEAVGERLVPPADVPEAAREDSPIFATAATRSSRPVPPALVPSAAPRVPLARSGRLEPPAPVGVRTTALVR